MIDNLLLKACLFFQSSLIHIHLSFKYPINKSQTNFSKYDRWDNVRSIFSIVKPKLLENKHVILIDDVLTTGATIEACVKELLKVKGCKVSIAVLAARI